MRLANLINRTQAAALLGVSAAAIDKALRANRITHADPKRKLFDAAALPGQWAANRRRQRRPTTPAAPVARVEAADVADDSVPALQHRRLRAEVTLLETKARVGHGTRVSTPSMERAFFTYHTMGRAACDTLHPKLLERLDELCPTSDPRYGALYTDLFRMVRETWAAVWVELAAAVMREHPEWGRRWFVEFAANEGGPAARAELERMRQAGEL